MTNQEAAEMIRNDMKLHHDSLSGEYRKALNMAISALQAQEAKNSTESSLTQKGLDTISRQAAIDAVEHITSSMSVCVNTDECHGMERMQRQAVIELANLPSAQPDNRLEKIADLVEGTIDHFDRDDAMDLLYQIKEVFK